MHKTRFRVNLHVYYRSVPDQRLVYDVIHIGFWETEQMARDVIAGLTLPGVAFAHRGSADYAPAGWVDAVLGLLIEAKDGEVIANRDLIELRRQAYDPLVEFPADAPA